MLKKLFIASLVLIAVLILAGFLLPSHYVVERSHVIDAPTTSIYPIISDLRTWPEWTAWSRQVDDDCKWTFTGDAGAGCKMSWDGPKLGKGELAIDRADTRSGIHYTMTMNGMEPLHGKIGFAVSESSTRVSWRDEVDIGNNPLFRWMAFLMLEDVLGREFERSLAALDTRVKNPSSGPVEASSEKK